MNFNIVFSDQEFPQNITKSIFLAGPSPRTYVSHQWRQDALEILSKINFNGTVFIPIPKNKFYSDMKDSDTWTYENQIEWELKARQISDIILFWIPRSTEHNLQGFTTNVEFGEDIHSGKITYGRPDNAEKCRYLDQRILSINEKVFNDLEQLIVYSINKLGNGALRQNGETFIPLFIWKTEQFQNWYTSLKNNGNSLIDAKLLHHFTSRHGVVFSFILKVNIFVAKENRYKSNEFIFSRKDISAVLPYYKENNEIFFVSVKEFRSPVRNNSGLIHELPAGSASSAYVNPLTNAQHELQEETGLFVEDVNRFKYVDTKQLCSTLSTHSCHLYKIELNKTEFQQIQSDIQNNKSFGLQDDSEIIHLQIVPLKDIHLFDFDYSMIGMVFSALIKEI